MELVKDQWTKEDIPEFIEYLKQFGNPERVEWSKNLLNTNLPVLAMKTADMKKVIKEIAKGNYLSFLDLMVWDYYENTAINGYLICKIKDFDTMKKYLDIYVNKADNWATCDLLSFSNVSKNEDRFHALSYEYIESDKPFVRRVGMYIQFYFIDDEHIDEIFSLLDRFTNEKEYYVNMMNSWLLCECFTKQREKTLKYIKKNKLNKFTINKGIQKCRESRRVSAEDKEMLLQYKVK